VFPRCNHSLGLFAMDQTVFNSRSLIIEAMIQLLNGTDNIRKGTYASQVNADTPAVWALVWFLPRCRRIEGSIYLAVRDDEFVSLYAAGIRSTRNRNRAKQPSVWPNGYFCSGAPAWNVSAYNRLRHPMPHPGGVASRSNGEETSHRDRRHAAPKRDHPGPIERNQPKRAYRSSSSP
jgi:hypothetical protein